MKNNVKYFYFFRGSLATHIHFYKCWVDVARKQGLPMEMVTFMDMGLYIKQGSLIKKYRTKYLHIYCGIFGRLNYMPIFLYFLWQCLFNEKVIVYLKKQPPDIFDKLKRIFPNRLRYAIELEGDPESEREFLLNHPYKEGFYDADIKNLEKEGFTLKNKIKNSDGIFVVTERFRDVLIDRYPELKLEDKISIVPIGFDKEEIFFSMEARNEIRRRLDLENKFVITYIGNVYYSWQNIYRTIESFKLINGKITENAFLILLIRNADHEIAKEFIKELKINENDYLLTQVDHREIYKYLSASDIGVLLRHKHLMNEVVTSGKIIDYFAAGLPVLTTNVVAKFPDEINKHGYGIILNDMDDDEELLRKILPFISFNIEKRKEISEWARLKFSAEAYAQEFVKALLELEK